MTSSTFAAARSSRVPAASPAYTTTSAQPQLDRREQAQYDHSPGTATSNGTRNPNHSTDSLPLGNDDTKLHAHRQNHNSSKLPAFRFADLRKDRISLPSLQQPTPLAPVLSQSTENQNAQLSGSSLNDLHHYSSFPDRPVSLETKQTGPPTRTRSLKFKLPTKTSSADSRPAPKRPVSDDVSAAKSQLSSVATTPLKRRMTESAAVGSAKGQRELLLPKTVESAKSGDKSRPPLTYRRAYTTDAAGGASSSSGRAVIPPIRGFRSSGSRKSVVLDMNTRRTSQDSYNDDAGSANPVDRALQALEGRRGDELSLPSPSESGEMTTTTDNDNTADIFLKLAREDPLPRASEKQAASAESSAISRIARTHRRPLSAALSQEPPLPQLSRRLSDQRENSRTRQTTGSQTPQQIQRESSYRSSARQSVPQIETPTEKPSRVQSSRTPLKSSPITPKQLSFKDSFSESSSSYQRRRQSLTENNSLSSSRTTQHRNANLGVSQPRTYHSSPLVPKSTNVLADEQQHGVETHHGVEGTESSSSTAAPSTVWDELDDLKSRIHRLERTGKMPSTPGGALSGSSDERPRTATTNATTVSASPKRGSGAAVPADSGNNISAHREAQPLLLSALSKTKDLVSPEVFSAIELAATDAMALASMIGHVGQPGPISSSASTIGGYSGGVTDRQLRKKADSICRSLTELCLALADSTGQKKQPQSTVVPPQDESLLSPTSHIPAASMPTQARRPSAVADSVAHDSPSPRAPTSLEQKRKTMLASISVPTPVRYAAAPSTPLESAGRKSSLLLGRMRRTATEDQDDTPQPGRRTSMLLRSRRGGSEEPEEPRSEGRKTSLLLRARRIVNDDDDESRSRAPSRAVTEVNGFRSVSGPISSASTSTQAPAENQSASSVLPRRRMLPAAIATRFATSLAAGSAGSGSAPTTPARKYLERSTLQDRSATHERPSYFDRVVHQDRGPIANLAERLAAEREKQQQRHSAMSQSTVLGRSGSLGRRARG